MSKKLTYEYVRQVFEDGGCEMLDTEYVGSLVKMKYECNCGREAYVSFSNFSQGHRCKGCKHDRIAEKNRFDYEYVRRFFEDHGCKLLDKEYKSAREHLNYKCSCGNVSKIIFSSFREGCRCKKCGVVKNAKAQAHSLEYVRSFFKKKWM